MNNTVRVIFGPGVDNIELMVGNQHLSRLTRLEVRDLISQVLIFGGCELRKEVTDWLQDDTMQKIAEVIA